MTVDNNILLIILSLVIVVSYLFNIISKWIKMPSVLLLIGLGMMIKIVADFYAVDYTIPNSTIELMGTLGLILIVLEASLELRLDKEKIPTVRNAFFAALVILLFFSFSMAFIIKYYLNIDLKRALISAIPLAVTSSAIAIPSVSFLEKKIKEFIIYEATFSDIIGILFFNYVIQDRVLNYITIKNFVVNIIIIIIVSLVGSFVLLVLLKKISGHIKSFLILAILLLIYAAGKIIHLPSLLLVISFGLLINNIALIRHPLFLQNFDPHSLKMDIIPFKHIVDESAFLIRTFFFVFFGYSVNIKELMDTQIILSGITILGISLLIRLIYLRVAVGKPERLVKLFLAPRGLITVLLFYSIPLKYVIPEFSIGIIFIVIIASGCLMTISLWIGKDESNDGILEESNEL